eukprot:TRINITY_DN746_c0_g2_i2.p1 TRINITY_DN746_c0_g2~~TRINITY_DN746_c0_g2_i2.p1  ORF type:complete len:205 (+),score=32.96 TRINITY_DN746_c0_g2_i2:72-686(+)
MLSRRYAIYYAPHTGQYSCDNCHGTILQGELLFGITNNDGTISSWRHVNCMTQLQLLNLFDSLNQLGQSFESINGIETLTSMEHVQLFLFFESLWTASPLSLVPRKTSSPSNPDPSYPYSSSSYPPNYPSSSSPSSPSPSPSPPPSSSSAYPHGSGYHHLSESSANLYSSHPMVSHPTQPMAKAARGGRSGQTRTRGGKPKPTT